MSLKEEMARYEHLTGEIAEHTPIIQIGAFLYGVDRSIEELEKIKEEVVNLCFIMYSNDGKNMVDITKDEIVYRINKHIAELKGENSNDT